MRKIFNLVIQDRSDSKERPIEFVESFEVREDVQDPEKALREAIKEFVLSDTDEAKAAISHTCGYFNWADAISAVPESLFIKHGLTLLKQVSIDVFVDHNEILCDLDADKSPALHKVKKLIKELISNGEKDTEYWARGDNFFAESVAEELSERNKKLRTLLVMETITEETINKLIEAEKDDSLVSMYEEILDNLL